MNSDSGVQFIARRRKRPRQEPSATHSTSTPRPTLPPLAMPPARYAGDGLDFRRPATGPSVPPEEDSEVIDLTNEPDSPELPRRQIPESSRRQPRPPRFGRDIMADVVNLEDEEEEQEPDPPSSPEVQFLSSTVRPPRPPPPPRTQSLTASNFWRLLPLPQMFRSTNDPRYRREVPWRAASHLSRGDLETLWIGEDAGGPMDLTINLDNAEWELLGLPPDIDRPERGRPGSSYKAPSPAPEGFTRSLAEDDVATCPNCDEELGTGDDTKQQIWVAKQCGHVYCGECATNRSLTRAKKANAKTRPFAKCQVADCGKPVSAPKAMFQVYL